MATDARAELQDFHTFLGRQLAKDGSPPSPDECLNMWQELREAVAAIREGLAESEAGLGRPYREVIDELRARSGAASTP